jgi:hypothetical protein
MHHVQTEQAAQFYLLVFHILDMELVGFSIENYVRKLSDTSNERSMNSNQFSQIVVVYFPLTCSDIIHTRFFLRWDLRVQPCEPLPIHSGKHFYIPIDSGEHVYDPLLLAFFLFVNCRLDKKMDSFDPRNIPRAVSNMPNETLKNSNLFLQAAVVRH